ncbi:MAG: hypothetical protein K6G88_05875, partial [Lachnospiraceae bacterium]|nr:hypothetical protein [Lachnospiraceae bacterium]
PRKISKRKELIINTIADMEHYQKHKESVKKEERKSFGEELLYALKNNVMIVEERLFSEYQGFYVYLPKNMKCDNPYVIVTRPKSNRYTVEMDTTKEMGVCQRIDYCLDNLNKDMKRHNIKLREYIIQQEEAHTTLSKGNIFDDVVYKLTERLNKIDEELKEESL